eukprot:90497-Prorocentrum_minimum.AAC.2
MDIKSYLREPHRAEGVPALPREGLLEHAGELGLLVGDHVVLVVLALGLICPRLHYFAEHGEGRVDGRGLHGRAGRGFIDQV